MEISDEENEILSENDNLETENEPVEPVETGDNNEDKGDEEEKKPVKPKRIVKNPRVTLNAERLKGPKGLGAIENHFERIKFKGKGHEEQDLNILLKTYEYWSHRLFPKFPFQESLEKIEKLGTKGPIQTYLKKVRSGLIDQELAPNGDTIEDSNSDNEVSSNRNVNQEIMDDIPIELTEEQLETIRRNREKAEILRKEKLRKIKEKATLLLNENQGNSERNEDGNLGENEQETMLMNETEKEGNKSESEQETMSMNEAEKGSMENDGIESEDIIAMCVEQSE